MQDALPEPIELSLGAPPPGLFHHSPVTGGYPDLGCVSLFGRSVSSWRSLLGSVLYVVIKGEKGVACILHTYRYSLSTDVTCEGPPCPFSQLPALPSQLDLCEQVFGLSAASVAQAVAQTNSYYGGQTPGATQVLYVNGECATRTWLYSITVAPAQHHPLLSSQGTLIPGMC